jgi:hypothetical protein
MRIESREKRTFWFVAFLSLAPDVIIGVVVAGLTQSGWLGVLATVVALQVLYLLIWLKNSAWAWTVFWLGGRKEVTKSFLSFLVDNGFPEPASYQTSVEGYLNSVADHDASPVETRLKAAAQLGAMSTRPLYGGIQHSMRLAMAYEDALEQYKKLFSRPPPLPR